MVVYGWTTNQLKEEMNYIKDVSSLRIFFFFLFYSLLVACKRVELEALI